MSHKEAFKQAARNWGTADANPRKRSIVDTTWRVIDHRLALLTQRAEGSLVADDVPTPAEGGGGEVGGGEGGGGGPVESGGSSAGGGKGGDDEGGGGEGGGV